MLKNEERGITLIALIITIIVLLVLAGVTIAMISNDTSVLQKSAEAEQRDVIGKAKDEVVIAAQEGLIKYYNNLNVEGIPVKSKLQTIEDNVAITIENLISADSQLTGSGITENIITLKTVDIEVTGTIGDNGGITWSNEI